MDRTLVRDMIQKLPETARLKITIAEIVSGEIWSVENAIGAIRYYCGSDFDDTLSSLQWIVELVKELEELQEQERERKRNHD